MGWECSESEEMRSLVQQRLEGDGRRAERGKGRGVERHL